MASGGRRRGLIFIIVALVIFAVLAVVFVLSRSVGSIFGSLTGSANQPGAVAVPQVSEKMTTIVVTTQTIKRGDQVTADKLATIGYPEKDLVAGTFLTKVEDVAGKYAKYDLEARMPLTGGLLSDGKVGSDAAFLIPKGYVAVSIPVTKLTAVSFAPQIGDHVNVIASMLVVDVDQNTQSRLPNKTGSAVPPRGASESDPGSLTVTASSGSGDLGRVDLDPTLNQPVYLVPSETQRPRLVSHMVIQDAIVLCVGDCSKGSLAAAAGEPSAQPTPAAGGEATPVPAIDKITLIVRPQDSITLNYLMLSSAQLSLALRSSNDLEPAAVEAVTLQYLFQTYNIPNPPKTVFETEPRKDELEFSLNDKQSSGAPVVGQ